MKKERTPTQVIQWKENKIPSSIILGRVLLVIGGILFLINSVNSLIYWGLCFGFHWLPSTTEGFADIKALFPDLSFWNNPLDLINVICDAFDPILCVLKFLAGLGAFAYVKDKGGRFIDWVAWAAIIGLGISVFDFATNVRALIQSNFDWKTFGLNFFSMQIDTLVYSIGWFLAKNWLD